MIKSTNDGTTISGTTEDAIIAVQENINVEEGTIPKLSPEELAICNSLSNAEKVIFLKDYFLLHQLSQ
ncbi:14110_t:CDS:2 [Acaulospora morrowiae]|uniref:14110_t:CDS:1 n=1 Tax=Acaulospora morrowiae TaxID=94023 RepID=A0A9N9CYF4_9GLOM|nr:14110_t:CDS:2 [Acaulospora morrowiae]